MRDGDDPTRSVTVAHPETPEVNSAQGRVPLTSIVDLLKALVRTPSRAGEDQAEPVLACVEKWSKTSGIVFRRVTGASGESLGLYAEISGSALGTRRTQAYYVLNATLDTAGFGSLDTWHCQPTEAAILDGWLYGRGSGDSKAGAAIFCHLLTGLSRRSAAFSGRLGLLLDVDEHTGQFGGARRFFDAMPTARPDGVMIGYPGFDRIIVGSRGFLRARVVVSGVAAHSGGTRQRGVNAVVRAARLVGELEESGFGIGATSSEFDHMPQLTVTAMRGGGSFSQIPDRCEIDLDLRLTPSFGAEDARSAVLAAIARHDAAHTTAPATRMSWIEGWPAYRVPDNHPMVEAMLEAGRTVLGQELPTAVAGPSNIGNYLASIRIPALCGFGVVSRNLHAADESIELASIEPVYRIYEHALLRLLAAA